MFSRILTVVSWVALLGLGISGITASVGWYLLETDSSSPLWNIGPKGYFFPLIGCPSMFTLWFGIPLYVLARIFSEKILRLERWPSNRLHGLVGCLALIYIVWTDVFFVLTWAAHMAPDAFEGWRQ